MSATVSPRALIAAGFTPIPLLASNDPKARKVPAYVDWQTRRFTPEDWKRGQGTGLRLGTIPGTRYALYCFDFDAHDVHQDGVGAYERTLAQLPGELRRRLALARSTGGSGRYILAYGPQHIANGTLRDATGIVGEFLGASRQVVAPRPAQWLQGSYSSIPRLTVEEFDLLLTAANYWPSIRATAQAGDVAINDPVVNTILDIPEMLEVDGVLRGITRQSFTGRILADEVPMTIRPPSATPYAPACGALAMRLRKSWATSPADAAPAGGPEEGTAIGAQSTTT